MSEACCNLKTKFDVLAACRSGAPRTRLLTSHALCAVLAHRLAPAHLAAVRCLSAWHLLAALHLPLKPEKAG